MRLVVLLTGSLLLSAAPVGAAPRVDPEERLARAIGGRVAGEPVRCLSLSKVRSSRIIDGIAIIYRAGGTLYVNRPRAGAESLDRWDGIRPLPIASRLCSVDVVELYDSSAGRDSGSVVLGDFVPYRKPK
jgi:hypothetical protein